MPTIQEKPPDPMSFDIDPPVLEVEEPKVPVRVLAPSEGEIGKDVDINTVHMSTIEESSTRYEDSPIEPVLFTQGELFLLSKFAPVAP
ncbi:hypothetical protein FRC11_009595, partial [Ceratobasidium sp. 423]